MCIFGSSKPADPKEPTRYQQQKEPNRRDTVGAQYRAASNRKKATKTLLADYQPADETAKKTLLGA